MAIHMLRRKFHSVRERSNTRSTVALLAVTAIGYVTAAVVHESLPPRNDPAAFAQPFRAVEVSSVDALPAPATLATMPGADTVRGSDAQIEDPRECDLARGISAACIFMD